MNSSFDSANVTTSISSEPKKLVFDVEGLTMAAVTGVCNGVNAVSKDLRVVEVNGGGGRDVTIVGHKRVDSREILLYR